MNNAFLAGFLQVAICQFTCTVGLPCTLSLFESGLPATPSVRISEAPCGTASVGVGLDVTEVSKSRIDLGVLESIVDHPHVHHICLASNSGPDPNFSTPFGTLDIVGPTSSAVHTCYFGGRCQVVVRGNKLTRVESVVFVTESATCGSEVPPAASLLFGLTNTQMVLPSAASSDFTYIEFGTVDPLLSSVTSLTLCWSAIGSSGRSVPVPVGSVILQGPILRDIEITCYLGAVCEFDYSVSADHSYLMISDSDVFACDRIISPVVWSGTSPVSVLTGPSHYSFGTPVEVNNVSTSKARLCWSASQDTFIVPVGFLSMAGPTRSDTMFSCISGSECRITLLGVFNAGERHAVSFRSSSCNSGPPVYLGSTQPADVIASLKNSSSVEAVFSAVGVVAGSLLVCYQAPDQQGSVAVQAGTLVLKGPRTLTDPLTCLLGKACSFDVQSDSTPFAVSLVASPLGSEDPCLLTGGATIWFESGMTQSLVELRGIDRGLILDEQRTVCWRQPDSVRAVPIGQWTIQGPRAGMDDVECTLNSPCRISLADATDSARVYLTFPGECVRSTKRTTIPVVRGGTNPAIRISETQFSFGEDPVLGSNGLFDICYADPNRPAVLGSLRLVNSLSVEPTTFCVIGEICSLLFSASLADPVSVWISSTSDCASRITDTFLSASIGVFPGGYVGSQFVCVSGVNVGAIEIRGATATARCTRGSSSCLIPLETAGTYDASKLTLVEEDCASSPVSIVTPDGSPYVFGVSGIVRVVGSSKSRLVVCYNSVRSGHLDLEGPAETEMHACWNSEDCPIGLPGGSVFVAETTQLGISGNPCLVTSQIPSWSADVGTHTLCWKGADVPIPAGTVEISGVGRSWNLSCTLSSRNSCVVSLDSVGDISGSVVSLSRDSTCSSNHAIFPYIGNNEFDLGVFSSGDQDVYLCWSRRVQTDPNQVRFPVGKITFVRSLCDTQLYFANLVRRAELVALVEAADLSCLVSISNQRISLIEFVVQNEYGSEKTLREMARLKRREFASLVTEAVVVSAISSGISVDLIELLASSCVVTKLSVLAAAQREDVCMLLVNRLDVAQLTEVLPVIATNPNLNACVKQVVGRDARVISEAAVLSSIEGNNLEGFRLMMKRCCGSCITSSVTDRIASTGKDDFWLVVNDIQAQACIYRTL